MGTTPDPGLTSGLRSNEHDRASHPRFEVTRLMTGEGIWAGSIERVGDGLEVVPLDLVDLLDDDPVYLVGVDLVSWPDCHLMDRTSGVRDQECHRLARGDLDLVWNEPQVVSHLDAHQARVIHGTNGRRIRSDDDHVAEHPGFEVTRLMARECIRSRAIKGEPQRLGL